ncbi:MAG: hypothetical protein ABF289_03685, partial [Clostridiales bacterium]
NNNDKAAIKEVLTHNTDFEISLEEKFEIIKQNTFRISKEFSKRNPFNKINSFKYFQKTILEEFKKHNPSLIQNENLSRDVEKFFENAWLRYPKKEGKNDISSDQKNILFNLGDGFLNCIERYLKYDIDLKINGGWKELQSGKKFFNSGYIDWTDKEFENKKNTCLKSDAERKKERIFALYNSKKEAGLL